MRLTGRPGKDWDRLMLSGRYEMLRLKEGECHVGGEFLLVYRLEDVGKHGLVIFVRAGTHAELFE